MYAAGDEGREAGDFDVFPQPEELELVASLVGRSIVAADWRDENPGSFWGGENEVCDLTLDDGRVVRFGAWGHDAWGAEITLRTAASEVV